MAEATARGARVLVVDKDRLTCRSLEREFSAHGPALSFCHEGKDALGRIRAARYDLVILDIRLPDANGIEVLEEIKRVSPETHVIVTSTDAGSANVRWAVAAGAAHFIEKPFDPSVVRAQAEALLRAYPATRRHPRYACRIPVRLSILAPLPHGTGSGFDDVKGIAENVAQGGIRVATNFPLAAGQLVRLKAGAGEVDDPLLHLIPPRATAEVRWTAIATGGFNAGLAFTRPLVLREALPGGAA